MSDKVHTDQEIGEFIIQQMGDHLEVLEAPGRIYVSIDLIRQAELIEVFLALPGGYVYRVDPLDWSNREQRHVSATQVDANLNEHYRYKWK